MLRERIGTDIHEHRPLRTDQQRHRRAGAQNCGMHGTCARIWITVNYMCTVLKGDVTAVNSC